MKWDDMDVAAGIIRVRRAQWHGVVSTTKTGTSRTVPMVAELGETLQKHQARLLARQVAGDIVTRSITGHVTAAMTEHYSGIRWGIRATRPRGPTRQWSASLRSC